MPEEPIFEMPAEEDRTIHDVEKGNGEPLGAALLIFLVKWVPPTMTIAELNTFGLKLYGRIVSEWMLRDVQESGDEG